MDFTGDSLDNDEQFDGRDKKKRRRTGLIFNGEGQMTKIYGEMGDGPHGPLLVLDGVTNRNTPANIATSSVCEPMVRHPALKLYLLLL